MDDRIEERRKLLYPVPVAATTIEGGRAEILQQMFLKTDDLIRKQTGSEGYAEDALNSLREAYGHAIVGMLIES